MNTAAYNTPEGIGSYLTSLYGLHALAAERAAAWKRRELLTPYCLLGRWYLSSMGELGRLSGDIPADAGISMPPVVREDELVERLRYGFGAERANVRYLIPGTPPLPHLTCAECSGSWVIEDAYDSIETTEIITVSFDGLEDRPLRSVLVQMAADCECGWRPIDLPCGLDDLLEPGDAGRFVVTRFRHLTCHRAMLLHEGRWAIERLLDEAEFPYAEARPIVNAHDGSDRPWFAFATPYGEIVVGRHYAEVATIDWSGTGHGFPDLFRGAHHNGHRFPHGPTFVRPRDDSEVITCLKHLLNAFRTAA